MITAISKICRLALFAFLGLSTLEVQAGHILGSDITYTYMAPNTYLVNVRWYRDCQGLPAGQQITICYNSVSANVGGSTILTMLPGGPTYLPTFPYWPPMTTSCQGGSSLGIEESIYQGVMNLPTAATDWIISFSTFPQNIGIGNNFMYVSATLDNINYPINSSSYFTHYPAFIHCVNQPAWDDLSTADPDGDSLSYHYIPILDNATACPHAPFQSPVPAFPPLQSSTPISMDSTNGSLTFTPTTVGMAMVSARVDEFRAGVLISSHSIEHVMYIVTGCTITGIDEVKTSSVNVHPNPANDVLLLDLNIEENPIYMEVTDVSGKISNIKFVAGNQNNYELDIQSLSKGIYTLRVVTENTSTVSRFVKL